MLNVLLVTFPFFALVLAGYVAARRTLLPLTAIAGLNSYVLFFALPCMLYKFGASLPLAQLLDPAVALTYLLCALLIVGFTIAISLNARIGWNDASFGALVAAFPNTGFMGVPLLTALLGATAAAPIIVTILVDMVVTSSLCIALSRLRPAGASGDAGQSLRLALKGALRGVLVNPLPWSILLGAAASAWQTELPIPIMKTVSLLADSASPVALFTIGAVLARAQMMAAEHKHARIAVGDYLPMAFIKLLVHPVLVLFVGVLAIRWGVPLERDALRVLVLVAALPSASNVSLLAERFGADNGRIARIILVSTSLAFLSFSGAVTLLTVR